MPLSEGDFAEDNDTWFRVLTEDKYIRKGRIHHSAFSGGRTIAPPDPAKNRPWSHELSGRLRSLSTDVQREAQEYCAEISRRTRQNKGFAGLMFSNVANLRTTLAARITTGVMYTPLPGTPSHADLTFTGSTAADITIPGVLVDWLQDAVTGLYPSQLSLLPGAPSGSRSP